jgi:hypothetical protein
MATKGYMDGRRKYSRPQAMLFSNNQGYRTPEGFWLPEGYEGADFLVLSDHGRQPINIQPQRIESRVRMVNGKMRSYYTTDKDVISTSWSLLPSRSFNINIDRNLTTSAVLDNDVHEYTVDGGAGGVELRDWFDNHPHPFYVFLAYDRYDKMYVDRLPDANAPQSNLHYYNDSKLCFFSSFDYTIEKRANCELWNVNLALEEA